MNFNSLHFLIFLVVVLLLYWVLPHKFRWVLLLIASYYFYMSWNPWLVFLMLGTTLVSYATAIAVSKTEKKVWKRVWLAAALIICLGALFFFKYFDFFISSIVNFLNLFSLHLDGFALNLILPIGISFYTFQTLSYVIDVYKGKFEAEKHFGYYALFVCYFPQLVAGPIERPADLIPQLKAEHKFDRDDFAAGFRILLVGFFYKCVIADCCGIYVNNVFNNVAEANGLSVLVAALLFFVQIYCDFAGYSEIATGVARMMGVQLTRNFNRPYLATSFSDLFRRWHITLTRWFTDYVYIPLGGSRKGVARKIINTFIVFLLCGLWHGANWTYVLWGAYVAFIMTLESLLGKPLKNFFAKRNVNVDGEMMTVLRRILMFVLYVPASIIFRSTSIIQAGTLFEKLFTAWGFGEGYFNETMNLLGFNSIAIVQIALSILCMTMIFYFGENGRVNKPQLLNDDTQCHEIQRLSAVIYTILIIAVCWLAVAGLENGSSFLYFQF